MTRKDYILIAAALRVSLPSPNQPRSDYISMLSQFRVTCASMADSLQADNARFVRERFLKACGIEERS